MSAILATITAVCAAIAALYQVLKMIGVIDDKREDGN